MKKIYLILLTSIALYALAGCSNAQADTKKSINKEPVVTNEEKTSDLTDSKDGITIEINNIKRNDDKISISAIFDNHIYNLVNSLNIDSTTLSDKTATSFTLLNSAMGGHHAEATWEFDNPDGKTLNIKAYEDITFTFNLEQ